PPSFLVHLSLPPRALPPFPTRRSSDLLTPGGKAALRRAWPVYRQAIHRQLTTRLSPQQCRELAALLGQVIATTDVDPPVNSASRSEEHTSELQSRGHLVCRLLLEKKKN